MLFQNVALKADFIGCRVVKVYEPSELEKSHLTEFDQDIRMADMPERFQLRDIPVCPPMDELELEEEARWIFKQCFNSRPTSKYVPSIQEIIMSDAGF